MSLTELLNAEHVASGVEAPSKKRALERLSELLSKDQAGISSNDIFNSLLARERLGGTGVGHGVAIPHGRLKNGQQILGAFVKLKEGVDFDALDNEPVDLLFALMVPEQANESHLQTLALLAKMFNNEEFRNKLRTTDDPEALLQLLLDESSRH